MHLTIVGNCQIMKQFVIVEDSLMSNTVHHLYLVEESKHAKTIGMLESFSEVPVFLVPVDDVHFQRQTHIVEGMLGTTVVLVSPVEVKTFDFVLIVQGSSEDVREAEAFLFFFGAVFGNGECDWKNKKNFVRCKSMSFKTDVFH